MAKAALIGHSGFVGTTLKEQAQFDHLYRSNNIQEIQNEEFDLVVCAGASAKKWIANKEPEQDLKSIESLISHLKTIKAKKFILISTVDVFKNPIQVNESTKIEEDGLHSYGLHRRYLEKFVESQFQNHLIVRLPGLVGKGLQKNIIFDFLNDNNVNQIESRNIFQFYPMNHLWKDIQIALRNNLKIIHLTAAPVSVSELVKRALGRDFKQEILPKTVNYDFQSIHANFWGNEKYQYNLEQELAAIRFYFSNEPKTLGSK